MASPATRIDLRTTKILAVDDNAPALDLLTQILIGFRIDKTVACRSAGEARDQLAVMAFDLIIIDGEMPVEDGASLIRHIRTHADQPNFTAPIILMSSHTPLSKVHLARDAGANLVIKKPIVPATLLGRIVWLAATSRQFVVAPGYCGPDRRFRKGPPPASVGERRAESLALASDPERAMSQDDIDGLFG